MVGHTYNPTLRRQEDHEFSDSLGYVVTSCLKKSKKESLSHTVAVMHCWRADDSSKAGTRKLVQTLLSWSLCIFTGYIRFFFIFLSHLLICGRGCLGMSKHVS